MMKLKNTWSNGLVFLLAIFLMGACKKEEPQPVEVPSPILSQPTVSTTEITSISVSSAVSGGDITDEGGTVVTARGICWDTESNPTIALATKTNDGTGAGLFSSAISGLAESTTYYVRAYATNEVGTSYGNEFSFATESSILKDIDGNIYDTIKIGDQVWMQENLKVSHYRNGDEIPQVTDRTQWANLTTGAWCYFSNYQGNEETHGIIYNWYAVNDPRGLAPEGWHVSTNSEWNILTTFLGGVNTAGGAMKASTNWNSPNTGATNSSGFTAYSSGARLGDGSFSFLGSLGLWWTSTIDPANASAAWYRVLYNNSTKSEVYHNYLSYGLYVRCVKD